MSGDRQHYLPAALIGGFGCRLPNKPLREAVVVVRELRSGNVYQGSAKTQACRHALYRLQEPPDGVDMDDIDNLWAKVESRIPDLVARLTNRNLGADDPQLLIEYAAMAGVRHPTFEDVAIDWNHHQKIQRPTLDQIQWMRVEGLLSHLKIMPSWRWRVLHSTDDSPRFMLSDRGWIYVQEPDQSSKAIFLPMGPTVGILGYLDANDLPPRRLPFDEHRDVVPSWVAWLNAAAGADHKLTNALYAHPDDEDSLRKLPEITTLSVNSSGPFRGAGFGANTLFQ